MSIDIYLTRSNQKVAHGIILQHIMLLKSKGFSGQINAFEISSEFQIPYKTVQSVMFDLHDQGHIASLKQSQ